MSIISLQKATSPRIAPASMAGGPARGTRALCLVRLTEHTQECGLLFWTLKCLLQLPKSALVQESTGSPSPTALGEGRAQSPSL